MEMYTFSHRDDVFNNIIEGAVALAKAQLNDPKGYKSETYDAKVKSVDEALGKRIVENTMFQARFDKDGLKMFKDPQVTQSILVHENFNAVISEVVSPIVPLVVNSVFERFIAETKQIGYGETARFIIESNDLFKVNAKGEGVRAGVAQPMYNNELTVNPQPYEISTSVDWYTLAAGVFDIGSFGLKIGRSFEAHIFLKIVAAMTAAASQFGAAYNTNGVTPTLWGTLRERVSAANGGMQVIGIGTSVALSNASLQGNFQTQIGQEMNKVGYLDEYLSVPLIAIENVLVPGTTNSTAVLALNDKVIYFVPVAGSSHPVKVVFEGGQTTISTDTTQRADRQYAINVDMRYGVAAVLGAKYGTITLA